MRKWIAAGALALAVLFAPGAAAAAPAPQSADQYAVIEMVNALRAEYGLPPYTVNPALMAAAQAHSAWAASLGTHSHSGAGGSTPTDRAVAAGYGGGRSVRVSENIYWGTMATPQSALNWWRNSPIHFRGMTSTNYAEIGAGVVYTASGGFFTLKFGIVLGDAPAAPPASAAGASPSDSAAAPAARVPLPVYIVEPVEVAEPQEDGSVIHVVGEGQNPWDIAEAYEVPVSEILALNRLSDAEIIRPGDELIIKPAPVPPAPEVIEGPYYHTVQEGQTLFGIAKGYNVPLWQVLELNGLNENSIIYPGNELLIVADPDATPTPRPAVYHVVTEGQTLVGIAFNYAVPLADLMAQNNLNQNSVIYPGDKLLVRPGDPTAAPTPEATATAAPDAAATGPAPTAAPADDEPAGSPPADSPEGTAAAEARAAPSEAPARSSSPPIRAPRAPAPGQGMLIGALVVVGLAGLGLVVYGAVSRRE